MLGIPPAPGRGRYTHFSDKSRAKNGLCSQLPYIAVVRFGVVERDSRMVGSRGRDDNGKTVEAILTMMMLVMAMTSLFNYSP